MLVFEAFSRKPVHLKKDGGQEPRKGEGAKDCKGDHGRPSQKVPICALNSYKSSFEPSGRIMRVRRRGIIHLRLISSFETFGSILSDPKPYTTLLSPQPNLENIGLSMPIPPDAHLPQP